ncbi:amidase family protein [uncultured Paraburkholderia sp.]|uniref:amidase family protein n=1 Tax=uncultured Paraburkholderia sp. TaxID=1822466 RepID=UPI00259A0C13|nr:amidase family protein [uncultured Paraburkholderia sp.]
MAIYLHRLDSANPGLNAIVAQKDPQLLMEEARRADSDLAAGNVRGPLHGIPQAPKDLASVKGLVSSQGSPLLAGGAAP